MAHVGSLYFVVDQQVRRQSTLGGLAARIRKSQRSRCAGCFLDVQREIAIADSIVTALASLTLLNPILYGYIRLPAAAWNNIVIGAAVFLLAVYQDWKDGARLDGKKNRRRRWIIGSAHPGSTNSIGRLHHRLAKTRLACVERFEIGL